MTGILEIAKQSGVSAATVSRVVNGKKEVNAQTRAHIQRIIEEAGYVPNKAARAMVLQRSFTIGMITPHAFTIFQHQLFSLVERRLRYYGYHTVQFFFDPCDNAGKDFISAIKSENLDGLILLCEIDDQAFSEYLATAGIPIVSGVGSYGAIPKVMIENRQAAYEAVCHLVRLGHRKIGMIRSGDSPFDAQRTAGYYQALNENDIVCDKNLVVYEPYCATGDGQNGMRRLLLRGRDFTAVFAATDELALGAMRVLKDERLRVPEDVSVVGFGDIEISNYAIPRLTTIHQPLDETGEQIALLLHRYISGSGTADLVLPHKLIVRESTCPPPH
jgi:LacI family transcriptional regulator